MRRRRLARFFRFGFGSVIVWDIWHFFDGIAKLNFDWLQGYPLREWLPDSNFNLAPLTDLLCEDWVALLFRSQGLLIDLLAAAFPHLPNPVSFTLAAYLAL